MGKNSILRFALIMLLACLPAFAQRGAGGFGYHQFSSYHAAPVYGSGGWYNGGYNGGFFPAFGGPGLYGASTSPLDVPPKYWWVSPYPSENPCQAGCNPNAGYEWDSVGTLILDTNPAKAQVTLDGIFAGTTDKLGPFQLPVGRHTLHIQFPGFEPSDVIVNFDQPGVQALNVELKRLTAFAKPAP
jgi:hypothetical protein